MHRVVIAGAGFGGLATATALRRAATPAELEIVIVDRREDFVMGLRKTWAILGMGALDNGRRPLSQVLDVDLVHGEIDEVDPTGLSLTVRGRTIATDALVLALGARHDMNAPPGLDEHAVNVWDRDEVGSAAAAVGAMTSGQRLLIGIFGTPYSCPPAPFELALLARDRLGPGVEITVFSPAPIALPVVGPVESAKVEQLLADSDIGFLPKHQAVSVGRRQVEFADQSTRSFDVLLAVPPHRCPGVLVAAGLAEAGGWVKTDRQTLETGHANVYAIGDCTVIPLANGLALPKAGIFAELQGEVVAARILARIHGEEPSITFAGEGFCFVETGGGRAAKASGAFLADPVAVGISEPTADALKDKKEFESSRLGKWFGG